MGRFREALAADGLAAIAEFKRASPSAGDIRRDARVEEIVPSYARAGAAAISVLVDERFAGSVDDLRAARRSSHDPPKRSSTRIEHAAAPAASNARASRAGSASGRRSPAEGERRLTSAMPPSPGLVSASRNRIA